MGAVESWLGESFLDDPNLVPRNNRIDGIRWRQGYLPFNGGPRVCIGQNFSLTEAKYTIVRLLQAFGGIEARDARPWMESINITMAIHQGCKVGMVPAA